MNAQDVMTQPVVSIAQDATILEAVGLMLRHRMRGLPVVETRQDNWSVS